MIKTKSKNKIALKPVEATSRDDNYPELLDHVRFVFKSHKGKTLFTTDVGDLFDVYLGTFPIEVRQQFNCNCCKHFINHFGGLVTIDTQGKTESVLWDGIGCPERYIPVIRKLKSLVAKAKVTGVFISGEATLGTPKTGEWSHLAVNGVPKYSNLLLTPGQAMAEKREDHKNVLRAIKEFDVAILQKVVTFLQAGSLPRPEKFLAPVEWLLELTTAFDRAPTTLRSNLVWNAIATSPAGFCHPRSSAVGSLLTDLSDGVEFNEASRRFKAKVAPDVYQRPVAAPTGGNIASAEKIVEKLGIKKSLERRFARIDEVEALWRPMVVRERSSAGGVFDKLKPKVVNAEMVDQRETTLTFAKFQNTVMASAQKIELLVPQTGSFIGILTAVNEDAPVILKWDNHFSWYTYTSPSLASHWQLRSGSFVNVTAITHLPSFWNGCKGAGFAPSAFFLLEGAKDMQNKTSALFPEVLRSDLFSVRSTLEAYSNSTPAQGAEEGTANGIYITGGVHVRVTLDGGVQVKYHIDRFD